MERAFSAANAPASATRLTTIQGVSKTAAERKDARVVATAVVAKESVTRAASGPRVEARHRGFALVEGRAGFQMVW